MRRWHLFVPMGWSTHTEKKSLQTFGCIVISPENWINIISTQITTTASQQWRDFNCVIFFITPEQKSKQTALPPKCWRECGHCTANHTQISWSCPALKSFWDEVHNTIREVLCYDIEFSCLSFYWTWTWKYLRQTDIFWKSSWHNMALASDGTSYCQGMVKCDQ